MGELLWLHSGGAFNKNPDNDLGNYPSRFEISGGPSDEQNIMNNLYDNIMPNEAVTDYRCFYLWNPNTSFAMEDIELELTQCNTCLTEIEYGSKLQDDIQQISITCLNESMPDIGGFIILDTEFGSPFTISYTGDWGAFGVEMQTRINEQPWCEDVTVTGINPFIITFTGGVGNRCVQPIRVVQNDLTNYGLCRYNTQIYFACDAWNGYNDSIVLVVQKISDHVPLTGFLRIYNPLNGLWDSYQYYNHDAYNFYLSTPLQFNLVGFLGSCPPIGVLYSPMYDPAYPGYYVSAYNDPQNWQRWYPSPVYVDKDGNSLPLPVPWGVIEAPCDHNYCQVDVCKIQEGSPINTIAKPILTEFNTPDSSFTNTLIEVGNLRPNEGFYLWIQRTARFISCCSFTDISRISGIGDPLCCSVISCCSQDFLSINVAGVKVDWPLQTYGG